MESQKTNQNGKYKYTNAKLRVKVENEYLPHINVNKFSCLFFGNVTNMECDQKMFEYSSGLRNEKEGRIRKE